ncbi:MAG: hypothetical protein GX786_02490 [Clostridiales bacterium]|nr:hypothetical protein [Clostridiales bacterium]
MQRHIQQDLARKRKRMFIILGIILVLIVAIVLRLVQNFSASSEITAVQLPISASYKIVPFGKNVLYYDGMNLNCITPTGATRWQIALGHDADFDTNGTSIVAWSNTQIYVIDGNGNPTHTDNLDSPIQFARIGEKYVGMITGEDSSPHLYITDLNGQYIDREHNAYEGYLLLNIGFFGDQDRYMWSLSFDVKGSVPDTILTTFQVGQKNTGSLSLGDALVRAVLYDNANLRVINTRQMRTFDYRGTENIQEAFLVYGWTLIDSHLPEKGSLSLLFAPSQQTSTQYRINELRVISGAMDIRYTLPSTCVGATVVGKSVYAFGGEYIYKAEVKADNSAQRFTPISMPSNVPGIPTDFLGATTDNVALIAFNNDIYALKLP